MEKSLFTEEYKVLLRLLREKRKGLGISQVQIAETLGSTQSFVSKCERGERRLDAIELRRWILGLGVAFLEFMTVFDEALSAKSRAKGGKRR